MLENSQSANISISSTHSDTIKEHEKAVQEEVAVTLIENAEIINSDLIDILKDQVSFLKNQLISKDKQLVNMQVLLKQEQQNKILMLESQKEHDIVLMQKLQDSMKRQKFKTEEERKRQKGIAERFKIWVVGEKKNF